MIELAKTPSTETRHGAIVHDVLSPAQRRGQALAALETGDTMGFLSVAARLDDPRIATADGQEAIYQEMITDTQRGIDAILANDATLLDFQMSLPHGERSEATRQTEDDLTKHFVRTWFPQHIEEVIEERRAHDDPLLRKSVQNVYPDSPTMQLLAKRALIDYVTTRDLMGPLNIGFVLSIDRLKKNGVIQGPVYGMLRDAYPIVATANQLGVDMNSIFLRRAFFGVRDAFDPADEAGATQSFSNRLVNLFHRNGLLTEPEVTLVDTGCYGTVGYRVAWAREAASYIATNGMQEKLISLPIQGRVAMLEEELPEDLRVALHAGNPEEIQASRQFLYALLHRTDILAQIPKKGLFTRLYDFYSHHYNDPRYPYPSLHQHGIPSFIDTVGEGIVPGGWAEIVNNTLEETSPVPKFWRGPTDLTEEGEPILLRNGLATELRARAGNKGVTDSIALLPQRPVHVRTTLNHMMELYKQSLRDGQFRGLMLELTPPWDEAHEFLGKIFPLLFKEHSPNSTYKPIPADAIIAP